jgi:Tfp pilus assembly protein PilV
MHFRQRTTSQAGKVLLRSGFSFAEVMFAVAILGVGFVMVAAVFPLAAEQTRSTADEAVAANLAGAAITTIQNVTTSTDFIPGNMSQTFTNVWSKVASVAIDPVDRRYAWIPFFSDASNGLTRVSILVVRRQIHDEYSATDTNSALLPRGIMIGDQSGDGIVGQADGTNIVYIQHDQAINSGNYAGNYHCVTTGTFLIIGTGDTNATGKTVRLGQLLSSTSACDTYQLQIGQGLESGDYCHGGTTASVIGRDFADAANPGLGYAGPAQDVAVYTTFIKPN